MAATTEHSPRRPSRRSSPARVEPERTGWTSWVTTTDHKRIGIMYLVLTFVFFILGGIEALLMRLQLGRPNNTLLDPKTYNELFTMHGTTMIFLFVVPIMAGFGNYFVPLMIGARDMAFPKLNALSFWLLVAGGLVFYALDLLQPARVRLDVLPAAVVDGLPAQRRRRRVDLPHPPHRPAARWWARSTSTRRSPTCARPAWAGAACRSSCGRS